jgi:hypothetical protein
MGTAAIGIGALIGGETTGIGAFAPGPEKRPPDELLVMVVLLEVPYCKTTLVEVTVIMIVALVLVVAVFTEVIGPAL